MKYAVVSVTDGNFTVHSEHGENLQGAKVEWHNYCKNLWNDAGTTRAEIKILDEQLDCVDGYKELINKAPAEPEE